MNAAAIHAADILVRFANPAQDGKPPNIRSADGATYGVKPADFGRFQPGGHYRIEYVEKQGRGKWQGRTFRDIVKCEPIRPTSAASGDARAPSPKRNSTEGEGAISNQELHFVTHAFAASISSMSIGRTQEDMVNRVKLLREVYREGFK